MNAPRSAFRLLEDTFELYGRYPVLFLAFAAAVIVPYDLVAFAVTGVASLSSSDMSVGTMLFFDLTNWGLVTPLVSALHVHAVADDRLDREPRIGSVARRGLKVLPVAAAATIAATLGMLVGFLLLIIPGVILFLRWAVVAQAAAIERESWLAALRRRLPSPREAEPDYWSPDPATRRDASRDRAIFFGRVTGVNMRCPMLTSTTTA